MIPGQREIRVAKFCYIDRCSKRTGWNVPGDGEEFWGIPHQYYGELSQPFIEIRKNGAVKQTVNCADVSCVDFEF